MERILCEEKAPCISAKHFHRTPHQYVIVFVIIPYSLSLQIADGDEDLKQPKNQKKKAQLGVKVC